MERESYMREALKEAEKALALEEVPIGAVVVKDGEIVEKKELVLPKEITNVFKCKNPRCITSIEQGLPHIFVLADEKKEIYRCKYCEEKYKQRVKTVVQ